MHDTKKPPYLTQCLRGKGDEIESAFEKSADILFRYFHWVMAVEACTADRQIADLARDKTVIFISHRLSSTRHADRIYLLDGGRIAECGTHDELMAAGGKYAEMFRAQAEKYLLGEAKLVRIEKAKTRRAYRSLVCSPLLRPISPHDVQLYA